MEVILYNVYDCCVGRYPKNITIYGSNDRTSWTEIGSLSVSSMPALGEEKEVECNNSSAYNYVRFNLENTFGNTEIRLSEIEITAKKIITHTLNSETLMCK